MAPVFLRRGEFFGVVMMDKDFQLNGAGDGKGSASLTGPCVHFLGEAVEGACPAHCDLE